MPERLTDPDAYDALARLILEAEAADGDASDEIGDDPGFVELPAASGS